MREVCENCAHCSESYPSFVISCDKHGHRIKNDEEESCKDFLAGDDAKSEMEDKNNDSIP